MIGNLRFIGVGLAFLLAQFVFATHPYAQERDWTEKLSDGLPKPIEKPKAESIPEDANPKSEPHTSEPQDKADSTPPKTTETPAFASRARACPAVVSNAVVAKYLPAVQTETLCGAEAPIEVTSVLDVALKPKAQLNCGMTEALVDWVSSAKLAAKRHGLGRLTSVNTASSYVCRRRNNRPDGKFSEHATMNALDVAGFTFDDKAQITVLDDWPKAEEGAGRFLREVHGQACATFTTVLGPDADDQHKNHFHLDLGCHGKSCTFLICQ